MNWLDTKYANMLSFKLRNFKRKNSSTINFSCNICGDSKTNRHKARAYIYDVKGNLWMHCHNCGASMKFANFLKTTDLNLYEEYIKEKLVEAYQDRSQSNNTTPVKIEKKDQPIDLNSTLKKISQLDSGHPAKIYCMRRMIPSNIHYKLFFCLKFKHWVNTVIPGKFESEDNDEPRLIIPFYNRDGKLTGFQGRSFRKKTSLRYITIMLDEDSPKIYGLESIDFSKNIYVFEGPIDSMFIPNSIACAGGVLTTQLKDIFADISKFTIVYDLEYRNTHTVKKIEKAIKLNLKVALIPDTYAKYGKDINEFVLNGLAPNKIKDIIDSNTYSGLAALAVLSQLRKD